MAKTSFTQEKCPQKYPTHSSAFSKLDVLAGNSNGINEKYSLNFQGVVPRAQNVGAK